MICTPFFSFLSPIFINIIILLFYSKLYYFIALYFIYDNFIAVKCMYLSIKMRYQKRKSHTHTYSWNRRTFLWNFMLWHDVYGVEDLSNTFCIARALLLILYSGPSGERGVGGGGEKGVFGGNSEIIGN